MSRECIIKSLVVNWKILVTHISKSITKNLQLTTKLIYLCIFLIWGIMSKSQHKVVMNKFSSSVWYYNMILYTPSYVCWLHPKLHNINLHNVTHSLISRNPRERMFVVQISLLAITFLSLISQILSLMQTTKESNPHPQLRIVGMECQLLIVILLLLMPLVECWCMDMPSGVDRTTPTGEWFKSPTWAKFSFLCWNDQHLQHI